MTEKEAARAALVMLLKRKRQGMTPAERTKRKKPARWLYPWATEHSYAVLIRAWVKPVIVYVREYIQKHHEAVLRGDGAEAVIRKDAVAGQSFYAMIQALNGWVGAYISDDDEKMLVSPIFKGLGKISDNAFAFNGTQYKKSVKSALGIDFPSDESWWPDARDFWRRQNYDLIRSDIKKYISDINAATERAVTNGLSVKSLMKEIQSLDAKITKSRANFIARDQIGKLNGIITQRRQEDIGLSMYEWSSSGDERVRSSHALMDGKLCRWDDATVYSEDGGKTWKPRPAGAVLMHPGQDYQCRCCALAWFDELIDEADENQNNSYIMQDGFRKDYNPLQPRDKNGRWTKGGGGSTSSAFKSTRDVSRKNLKNSLQKSLNKPSTNTNTGETAKLTSRSISKMSSDKAIAKSIGNGFTEEEHFLAANKVLKLYEKSKLVHIDKDTKHNPPDPNIKSIKRYVAKTTLHKKKVDVLITVKETTCNKIYSIEVEKRNRASTRWQAENSATSNP